MYGDSHKQTDDGSMPTKKLAAGTHEKVHLIQN
jgi:hypothetical protein